MLPILTVVCAFAVVNPFPSLRIYQQIEQLGLITEDRTPLRSIATDRAWLRRLQERLEAREGAPPAGEWREYEYAEPPYIDKEDP